MRLGRVRRSVASTILSPQSVVTAAEVAAMPDLTGPYEQPRIFFKPSSDPSLPPSILFGSAPAGTQAIEGPAEGLGAGQPLYKITSPTCDYVSLRLVLLRAGFRRIGMTPRYDALPANLVWGKSLPSKTLQPGSQKERAYLSTRLIHPYQRFNHFPGSHANLGCKAGLSLNLAKEAARTDSFNPTTMLYPAHRKAIHEWIASSAPNECFIWKPARGSCGRGIMICSGGAGGSAVQEVRAVEDRIASKVRECEVAGLSPAMYKNYVVQRYIADPLLIDGKKFDLRLYVAVTGFVPTIVAYRHEQGFARFAATPYREDAIGERFSHLTNFSIGRKVFMDKLYASPPAKSGEGEARTSTGAEGGLSIDVEALKEASEKASELKWTVERLNAVLRDEPHRITAAAGVAVDTDAIWASIDEVIRSTLRAAQPRIARRMAEADEAQSAGIGRPARFSDSYFELYGFDIMLDSRCRPWLIEVNTLPSLESSSVRDYYLKSAVVSDLLNIAMIRPFDRTEAERALFATSKVPAVLLSSEGDSHTNSSALQASASACTGASQCRDALSPPSEAAARFLIGARDEDRYHSAATEEIAKRRALAVRDEGVYSGGFKRLL